MFASTNSSPVIPEPKRQSRQAEAIVTGSLDGILNAICSQICVVYCIMIHTFGLICKFALIAD